ncbi:MAG: helix-turn-helix domain-containing protein [Bacteroidales bacterium]|jgi:AraC-like DNA-binding protein|nr:helix-turn-helix domain-containing protein [Bacteroidales bacterium]
METSSQLKELTDFIDDIQFDRVINYENKIILIDLNHLPAEEEDHLAIPIRLNAFTIFLVTAGELHITIDYKPYTIKKNMMFTLIEKHIINNVFSSEDFRGFHIVVEHDFFKNSTDDEKPPLDVLNAGKPNPIIGLQDMDFSRIVENVEKLKKDILREEYFYRAKIIKNDFANLMFEIWNLLIQKFETEVYKPQNAYELIVVHFFDLLFKHSTQEHEVAFYAKKLNITPIYLSRVVKQVIGKTSIKVISDVILMDAKILLRNKKITIQQIADKLNFSDQASFSKFFKKNTGKSPIEYRKCL